MPQELLSLRRELEISDPIAVGAKEIEISQMRMLKQIEFPGGKLRTQGLVSTLENQPEVHLDE